MVLVMSIIIIVFIVITLDIILILIMGKLDFFINKQYHFASIIHYPSIVFYNFPNSFE